MGVLNVVIYILIAVFALVAGSIFLLVYIRDKRIANGETPKDETKQKNKPANKELRRGSVFDFLNFDKIEDDMIVQKDGSKYNMVIKCEGINFDLMSPGERMGVEEGFTQLLNTLRYPIQLYVQTRSASFSDSLDLYNERIDKIEQEINRIIKRYEDLIKRGTGTEEELDMLEFEVQRRQNMLDYGRDITSYINQMNLNRNILQRKFYIIISYHSTELGISNSFSQEEIHDIAYQELYTRVESLISSLHGCRVSSSILDSEGLLELLYIAYNRDEAEIYNFRKAVNSGFYSLYTTGRNLEQKKQELIETKIKEKAEEKAQHAIDDSIQTFEEMYRDENFVKLYQEAIEKQSLDILFAARGQFPDEVLRMAVGQVSDIIDKLKEKDEEEKKNSIIERSKKAIENKSNKTKINNETTSVKDKRAVRIKKII